MNAYCPIANAKTSSVIAHEPSSSTCELQREETALSLQSPDSLPGARFLGEDGIYERRTNADGDEEHVLICSKFVVLGICSRTGGRCWGRVIEVTDPESRKHRIVIDETSLSGSDAAIIKPLRERGLFVAPVGKAVRSIANLIREWRPAARFIRVDGAGWVDDRFNSFVTPRGEVVGSRLVVPSSPGDDEVAHSPKSTIEEWRQEVAARCVENPLMILAVSQAFSGPLLEPLGFDGGGFHFRGASSSGKSTILGVGASVWGPPSFVRSWRSTDNGMETVASVSNGTLLALDELHQASPHSVDDVVYMLANGKAKARANSRSLATRTATWKAPLISSGELSLSDHLRSVGRRFFDGLEVRLVDVCADDRRFGAFDHVHDARDARHFAGVMQTATFRYHGAAGPAFATKLIRNPRSIEIARKVIDDSCETFRQIIGVPLDPQAQRVLRRFSVAGVAGEMATRYGLTGWPRGAALRASLEIFKRWVADRNEAELTEITEVLNKTRRYLEPNNHRFSEVDAGTHRPGDGWKDQSWFYILPNAWRRIHGEAEAPEAARIHNRQGLLKTQANGGYKYRMPRSISGRPKVYAVAASILTNSPR